MSDVHLACYLRVNLVGELALCCLECSNRFRGNTSSDSSDMNTRMSFKPELISNLISLSFSNKKVGITGSFHWNGDKRSYSRNTAVRILMDCLRFVCLYAGRMVDNSVIPLA